MKAHVVQPHAFQNLLQFRWDPCSEHVVGFRLEVHVCVLSQRLSFLFPKERNTTLFGLIKFNHRTDFFKSFFIAKYGLKQEKQATNEDMFIVVEWWGCAPVSLALLSLRATLELRLLCPRLRSVMNCPLAGELAPFLASLLPKIWCLSLSSLT